MEVAHRLYETPGKCENIHGHSMYVSLEIEGDIDSKGMVLGLDFGDVKKLFRTFLDNGYDHRLLLNQNDPWAGMFSMGQAGKGLDQPDMHLPGLAIMNNDPTTENIAAEIGWWARSNWGDADMIEVSVKETRVNAAHWNWSAE
jgi:6-pyruvoyltetrahydropterin/6-carboxytetrahydropterin synthase